MQRGSLWIGIALAGMLLPLAAGAQNKPASPPPPVRSGLEFYHGYYVLDLDFFNMNHADLDAYWNSLIDYEFGPPTIMQTTPGHEQDRQYYRGLYLLEYDFPEMTNADLDNYWNSLVAHG